MRLRTDGEALITDIRAAPVIPGSAETEALFSQGFVPLHLFVHDESSRSSNPCILLQIPTGMGGFGRLVLISRFTVVDQARYEAA